jgi:hypothetical protein
MKSQSDLLELFHIEEPKLTFGYGQRLSDPRDGIILFGPYTRDKLSGQINVGIIGPVDQRESMKHYLESIQGPIVPEVFDVARPYFPGLEAAFGISINTSNLKEIDVPKDEVVKYLSYSDTHQRIHNLCNLYSDRLMKYQKEEEMPVNVWFVIIPDEVYVLGKPKSIVKNSSSAVKVHLSKKERFSPQVFLFDDMNDLRGAYEFEANFHNQLKAKLLQSKIVTQIIREGTIAYYRLWDDAERINREKKFDTAKAWNISTTLYYKAGGLPWKLGEIRKGVCYLGLVYKRLDQDGEIDRNACCAAQMFLDSGDGVVFKGHMGPWYNPETKEFHLDRSDAKNMLSHALESYRDRSGGSEYPKEVFIHAKTQFDDEEWQGFLDASQNKCKIVGVRIRSVVPLKLYRNKVYCVPRGTVLKFSETKAHLWTKGFVPRLQTQVGLETPNSLEIDVSKGECDIKIVCQDILALTKLNYNSCIFGDGLPVTLRFADRIGEVLTAGKNIESGVLPFKHYV